MLVDVGVDEDVALVSSTPFVRLGSWVVVSGCIPLDIIRVGWGGGAVEARRCAIALAFRIRVCRSSAAGMVVLDDSCSTGN